MYTTKRPPGILYSRQPFLIVVCFFKQTCLLVQLHFFSWNHRYCALGNRTVISAIAFHLLFVLVFGFL